MIYMLQKIKSDLRRARIRHEKSYAKVERLREKLADLCCADRFVGGVSAAMRFFGKLAERIVSLLERDVAAMTALL